MFPAPPPFLKRHGTLQPAVPAPARARPSTARPEAAGPPIRAGSTDRGPHSPRGWGESRGFTPRGPGRSLHPCGLQQTCARARGKETHQRLQRELKAHLPGPRSWTQVPRLPVDVAVVPLPSPCPVPVLPPPHPQPGHRGRRGTSPRFCCLLSSQNIPPRKTHVPQAPRARALCCCPLQSPTSPPAPGWHQRDLGRDDAALGPPATVCAEPQAQDLFACAPSDVRINLGAMQKLGEHGAISSPQLSPPCQPSPAPYCHPWREQSPAQAVHSPRPSSAT